MGALKLHQDSGQIWDKEDVTYVFHGCQELNKAMGMSFYLPSSDPRPLIKSIISTDCNNRRKNL
jgi:hypothetical protein